jgi:hypothetical protein
MISHTKKNQSRFWRQQKELLVLRRSSFAKSSGITTPRKKLLGSEKMIFEKIIHTFLLSFPNLEDEIHIKGYRFVTSQF